MLPSLPLLRKEITFSEANKAEVKILHRLGYPQKRLDFLTHVVLQREWIKAMRDWLYGTYNICIPVTIRGTKCVMFRLPLPHAVGDAFRPKIAWPTTVNSGYMLVEFVQETTGKMLSCTWEEKKNDEKLRTNLYRDLSRIFLSLARIPLPKIGS
ncbi:hypothetical protein FQN57_005934 [Myotisia sp. PD_48]|nr:hypothetical protein FQN57_005934 [Myotisia sp. PD_48]